MVGHLLIPYHGTMIWNTAHMQVSEVGGQAGSGGAICIGSDNSNTSTPPINLCPVILHKE